MAARRECTEDGEEKGWFDCSKCSTVDDLGFVIPRLIFVGLMSRDVMTFMAARKDETQDWPHGQNVDQSIWCHDVTGVTTYHILYA